MSVNTCSQQKRGNISSNSSNIYSDYYNYTVIVFILSGQSIFKHTDNNAWFPMFFISYFSYNSMNAIYSISGLFLVSDTGVAFFGLLGYLAFLIALFVSRVSR